MKTMNGRILMVALVGTFCFAPPVEAKDYKIDVEVNRPAAISLRGAKKLAVTATGSGCDQEIANRLSARLFESGAFEMMERAQLERIMKEHDLSVQGLTDPSKVKEMGKVIPVDAIVYASVDRCGVEEKKGVTPLKKKNTDGTCVTVDAPITVRDGMLNVTFKVVHVESGSQLAVKDFKAANASSFVTDPYPDNADCYNILLETSPKAGNRNFRSEDETRNALIDSVTVNFAHVIAPHREKVTLIWEDEVGKVETDQIINYLQAELFDDAVQLLEQRRGAIESDTAMKPKDKDKKLIAAYYDSGLLAEMKGELTTAKDWYKKAFEMNIKDPDRKVKDAMKRIGVLIRERETLQLQAEAN